MSKRHTVQVSEANSQGVSKIEQPLPKKRPADCSAEVLGAASWPPPKWLVFTKAQFLGRMVGRAIVWPPDPSAQWGRKDVEYIETAHEEWIGFVSDDDVLDQWMIKKW